MQKIVGGASILNGFDVSHWESALEWFRPKSEGMQFCFIKASEGQFADPMFRKHWAAAKANNIIRGAYCFYHHGQDPLTQANVFYRAVGALGLGDLPLVMDWETTDNTPSAQDVKDALIFLGRIEQLSGMRPIIYTGPYFFDALNAPHAGFEQYPLWIAHYTNDAPLVPAPWKNWAFWQWSDQQEVGGIKMDVNKFNGTLDQLKALTKQA